MDEKIFYLLPVFGLPGFMDVSLKYMVCKQVYVCEVGQVAGWFSVVA